jgi:hypothetical protein
MSRLFTGALLGGPVIPAKAGIQAVWGWNWLPAFAGMTNGKKSQVFAQSPVSRVAREPIAVL